MTRGHRVAFATASVLGGALLINALVSVGPSSQGPITNALAQLGSLVGSLEVNVRRHLSGPGRTAGLNWFEPFRANPDQLKKPDRILLGAYDSQINDTLEGVTEIERTLGTTLPLLHFYTAWGDKPEQQFPLRLVTAIWDMGSVPVITWEPWLTDFENATHPSLPLRSERDRHGLLAVARGDYDFYVDTWAAAAASFGRPILVRLGHEMNDPYRYPWGPHNNTKEEFIQAWQHVVRRFRRAGATNVLWIWAPHVAYTYWELYYPGADFVDWVSTGALNFGTVAHWSQWWSFDELFGPKYETLASFGKPVMVDELGSLAVGGDRASWYAKALTGLPERYPAVRAVLFFHAREDQTMTYQKVNWSFVNEPEVAQGIGAAIRAWPNATPAR